MPCYNDGLYIQEAIDSVLAQTYETVELVIIDDCSTDQQTKDILKSIDNPHITVLYNSKNLGPSAARNKGIDHASGLYILPVDSDDKIDKTYIQKAVKILESDNAIGAVYCQAELFGERSGRWELPDYSFDKMLLDNIVFVTSLFRKSDWEACGGFSDEFDTGMEDYDFWLSILGMDKTICQIPEVLFFYRIKKKSRTTEFVSNMNSAQEIYRKLFRRHKNFYEKHWDEYCVVLRDALVERILIYESLKKSVDVYNKLCRIPGVKWFVKKFMLRK